jgi:hypothetical protein
MAKMVPGGELGSPEVRSDGLASPEVKGTPARNRITYLNTK